MQPNLLLSLTRNFIRLKSFNHCHHRVQIISVRCSAFSKRGSISKVVLIVLVRYRSAYRLGQKLWVGIADTKLILLLGRVAN